MKKIAFACVLLFSFLYSAGQDFSLLKKMENADLQVRQKPGTDALLAAWLADEDVAVERNCYSIFEIADADLPPVDTAMFYTYEYAKPFRSVFCRLIEDVRVTHDKIYCLVAYGDMSDPNDGRTRRTFITVDRRTGERREYLYPQEAGWTVFTRGLREKDGRVYPFSVLKRGGEALLRVYGEDGAEL